MRIERLAVTPIALGDPPLLNAAGLHAPFALRIIVELQTDAGITGLGEIPGDAEVLAGLSRAAPHLTGLRVQDARAIRAVLTAAFDPMVEDNRGERSWDSRKLTHAISALDVACLDAIGKRLDCRVADLLGGVAREQVPFAGYLFFKYEGAGGPLGFESSGETTGWQSARRAEALTADELVNQARAMVDTFGFGALKVKAGILDPEVEVQATCALRETFGPDMPLRIDPNAAWSFDTALRYGRRLSGVIEYYEDPVRGQDQMARLRRMLDIPLATNMCTTSFADLPASIALGSEDIILADHHYWGGLRASMELARICDVFGRGLAMHSNSHAGISLAAMVQFGAALPSLNFDFDTHYPWQMDDVLAGGKLPIRHGSVSLPDGPGLGVELDRAELARLHTAYLNAGIERRDDEAEMQKKMPGWRFLATRY